METGENTGPDGRAGSASRLGTRTRIIDAAARLYLRQGDAPTTIDEIAASAGLSSGAVYRHFGGKRELEQAMIDEALTLAESYLADGRLATSPIQRVRAAGSVYFRVAVEFPVAIRLYAVRALRTDGARQSERFDASVTVRTREMLISVAADIRQAMDSGEIPAGRVADAMLFLWGAWSGVIDLMLRRDELAIDADAAARALDFGQHAMGSALAHVRSDPGSWQPEAHLQQAEWTTISPPPEPETDAE